MQLHYRKYGEGQPLVILHGLFGSSDNWQTLGKQFANDFEVYLVDQRNHGRSPKSEEFNYQIMADDLHELISSLDLDEIILVGHSMGGKAVMTYAQQHPEYIEKLVVVDIGVKQYPMHHDLIIEGLTSIDLDVINTRKGAEEQLSRYIKDFGVKQFLLKNLYWESKGRLGWRINLPVLIDRMPDILSEVPPFRVETPTMFIRGDQSNYILEDDYDDISFLFPDVKMETVVDSGHWVHAEKPKEFYELIMDFSKS